MYLVSKVESNNSSTISILSSILDTHTKVNEKNGGVNKNYSDHSSLHMEYINYQLQSLLQCQTKIFHK